MGYVRLFVVAVAAEVLLSFVVCIGIYYGAEVFPLLMESTSPSAAGTSSSGIAVGGPMTTTTTTTTTTEQFAFTLPVGMPVLQDLRMPLTYLNAGELRFGWLALLLSIVAVLIQSYARGVYLGGLRSMILHGRDAGLLRAGNYFFMRMLGWNILQWAAFGFVYLMGQMFLPLGLLLMVLLFFYAFTPYVIVLLDVRLDEGLNLAPGLFRRTFGKLLPLALLAMLCTFACSYMKTVPRPYDYYFSLLVYIPVGTYLIYELMSRLAIHLRSEQHTLRELKHERTRSMPLMARYTRFGWALIFLILPMGGVAAASGYVQLPLTLSSASTVQYTGTSFWSNWSEAFYRSEYQYATYGWREANANAIRIQLPDLIGGTVVNELRGVAEVTWQIERNRLVRDGAMTSTEMEEVTRTDRLQYRLQRETTAEGAVYYSSRSGSASLISVLDKGGAPQAVDMMVSGDGRHVFVLLRPSRFDAMPVWRVVDGKYLIPLTSHNNPLDFRYYWFSSDPLAAGDLFGMIEAKNSEMRLGSVPAPQWLLPAALQEADGEMVKLLLDDLEPDGANITIPDWDADTWTSELRARYEGAATEDVLKSLTRTGEASIRDLTVIQSTAKGGNRYYFPIPFPNGDMTLIFEELADGALHELIIDPTGKARE